MIDENIAYLTDPDGTKYQVLNELGDDWDEAATRALYEAARLALSPPEPQEE
jgi:hypothetical protein